MSISIYYSARRNEALTDEERLAIDACIARYPPPVQKRSFFGREPQEWETFCIYKPTARTAKETLLEGATKLPDRSAKLLWAGVQHWCALLSELRRVLPDATWRVSVDDQEMRWDAAAQRYDPSASG